MHRLTFRAIASWPWRDLSAGRGIAHSDSIRGPTYEVQYLVRLKIGVLANWISIGVIFPTKRYGLSYHRFLSVILCAICLDCSSYKLKGKLNNNTRNLPGLLLQGF